MEFNPEHFFSFHQGVRSPKSFKAPVETTISRGNTALWARGKGKRMGRGHRRFLPYSMVKQVELSQQKLKNKHLNYMARPAAMFRTKRQTRPGLSYFKPQRFRTHTRPLSRYGLLASTRPPTSKRSLFVTVYAPSSWATTLATSVQTCCGHGRMVGGTGAKRFGTRHHPCTTPI